jgi:hypothetical protein
VNKTCTSAPTKRGQSKADNDALYHESRATLLAAHREIEAILRVQPLRSIGDPVMRQRFRDVLDSIAVRAWGELGSSSSPTSAERSKR